MSSLWVIAYDIEDNKSRKTVNQLLKNYGSRVQYSIFECRLTHTQQKMLRNKIKETIDETDKVRWYSLCKHCETQISWQGMGEPSDKNLFYIA